MRVNDLMVENLGNFVEGSHFCILYKGHVFLSGVVGNF